jgi:uncharacterized protein (TIGR00661 family)
MSKLVPRPTKKDWFTEMVLKYHSPCNAYYSFHFKSYDTNIFTPIIRDEIRNGENKTSKTIVVYLPSISAEKLSPYFENFKQYTFYIFCKHSKEPYKIGNAEVLKIDNALYIQRLLSCESVICNAGFESPSEAIYLGKKLMCITMKGQYEQRCNAQALKDLGVFVVDEFDNNFQKYLTDWMNIKHAIQISYPNNTDAIIQSVMNEFKIK